jgi:hypothetical protein
VARPSILSDELLRHLVAVGQVDILVGVPTFNNAATVEAVVRSLHVGLAEHFPRERTALVNPDGGSDDGTVDLVRDAPMAREEIRGSPGLRTTHRVSARHTGLPGSGAGARVVFAAADLLQARTVVLFDADVANPSPDWVADLARPVQRNEADLVLPIHPRHRFDGPLLTQLVRPLLGTAYARRLACSLTGPFACSGRFAAHLAAHGVWDSDLARPALDVWWLANALADDLRVQQAHLGPCTFAPRAGNPGLPELFEQVVGTAFTCLDRHAAVWTARTEPADLTVIGQPREPAGPERIVDPAPLAERFRSGLRDLTPLLRDILTPGTLEGLQAAAASGEQPPRILDPLWVTTVYEFAASAHRAVMNRNHLAQALVPLYLGRTASYFAEIASAGSVAIPAETLATLEREYERQRPRLVERWNADGGR